jgi:RNA polymerase sigma-70 factor (ECF subfamily)
MFFRKKVPFEAEFQALLARWGRFVRQTLRNLDSQLSEADLEEVEQEIRLRLWQTLSRERNWDKPASFIRSVVVSVAIDAARKRQVRGADREHVGMEAWDAQHHGPVGHEERAQLNALMKSLLAQDPETAQALGLYLQGFTTIEIGEALRWTEAKARNVVYRSLEALRGGKNDGT